MYTTGYKKILKLIQHEYDVLLYNDIELCTLGKQIGFTKKQFNLACEELSEKITKKKKIQKKDLSILELLSLRNGFSNKSIKKLQYCYKKYSKNTKYSPYFYIAIPIANRYQQLNNLLKSIQDEINLFGYQTDHIIVHIFNDGTSDIEIHGKYSYETKIWNINEQKKYLIDNYNNKQLQSIFGIFIDDLNKNNRTLKGSSVTMNVAKLILNKLIKKKNSLIRFIDSDQDFSILTKKDKTFYKIPHTFSIFHSYANIFNNKKINIATGKIVGDPAFASVTMLRTQLIDLYNKEKNKKLDINNHNYYHEKRAFYDLNLFTKEQENEYYKTGFPYLPYKINKKKIFHKWYSILFGHHVTRPILYGFNNIGFNKNGTINKIITKGDIIRPGNVVFRKKSLLYPTRFACEKIRIHGPISGYIINQLLGEDIYIVNIPCFHNRMERENTLSQGYRSGTTKSNNYIDISELWHKQIEGDIVLEYLKNVYSQNIHKNFNEDIYNKAYNKVINQYKKNIGEIKNLIKNKSKKGKDIDILINSIKMSLTTLNLDYYITIKNNIKKFASIIKNIKKDYNNRRVLLTSDNL